MQISFILMLWTVVGLSSGSNYSKPIYDWRPIGEFSSQRYYGHESEKDALDNCQKAARELGIKENRYRCIRNI